MCLGESTTSSTQCSCRDRLPRTCRNCSLPLDPTELGPVCWRCLNNPCCPSCRRHMSRESFHPSGTCHACVNRKFNNATNRSRVSNNRTVNEITLPTGDSSYHDFFDRSCGEINRIAQEHLRDLQFVIYVLFFV